MTPIALHPDIAQFAANFSGGTLKCDCAQDAVEVRVGTQVAHNHACGCSKCWKPNGAMFSLVGVVPHDTLHVTSHAAKNCKW